MQRAVPFGLICRTAKPSRKCRSGMAAGTVGIPELVLSRRRYTARGNLSARDEIVGRDGEGLHSKAIGTLGRKPCPRSVGIDANC